MSGKTTFASYVEKIWWLSWQREASAKSRYRSYLDRHFLPFFDQLPMVDILSCTVQAC